jgi:prenyltransferase beta subunit
MRAYIPLTLVLLLAPALPGQTTDEKKETIKYLQSLQTSAGGYRADARGEKSSLRGTSASLRALRYFGGEAMHFAECKKFVLSCHDEKTGGFANEPGGKLDAILTSIGLMALVELKVPTAPYEKAAIKFMADNAKSFEEVRMAAAGLETIGKKSERNDEWLARLAKMRNSDGTFGKGKGLARATGGAVAAELRLGGKVDDPVAIVKSLDANQRKDGGFGREDSDGSDLETTYRVTRTYVMLKSRPARSDDLRNFVALCRNRDGGYGVSPGVPSSAGGTYFASIILHWLASK